MEGLDSEAEEMQHYGTGNKNPLYALQNRVT